MFSFEVSTYMEGGFPVITETIPWRGNKGPNTAHCGMEQESVIRVPPSPDMVSYVTRVTCKKVL